MESVGVVYVAYGDNARDEATASIASLKKYNDLPVCTVGEKPIGDAQLIKFDEPGAGARWAKLNIDRIVDWDKVIYLDADTRINTDLNPLVKMLNTFDLVLTYSVNQGRDLMSHVGNEERGETLIELGNPYPLQLQAGVMAFNRLRCLNLFVAWREEWQRWHGQDQAALLRALHREPVRIGLLGRCWNGGELIEHLFGRAK